MRVRVLALLPLVLAIGATPAASQPFRTAVYDPVASNASTTDLARIHRTGATAERVIATWSTIAPPSPGPSFDARDPAALGYRWDSLDSQLAALVSAGDDPI